MKENKEIEDSMGVMVKFNVTTEVHLIPDNEYEKLIIELKEARYAKFSDYKQKLLAGSQHETRMFHEGDIDVIPRWYYEKHKNDVVARPLHIPTYTNDHGDLTPFNLKEAIKHQQIERGTSTISSIRKFEIVDNRI